MVVPMKYRQPVLLGLLLLSVLSLFVSRAGLSITMIAFIVVTSLHRDLPAQLKRLVHTPLLFGMSLLFLLPLVSGIWSDDQQQWTSILRIKLPLLFFPLAFAGSWKLEDRHWRILAGFFVLCVAVGAAWSAGGYLLDYAGHNEAFLRAKTFATPLQDDHVRFSWLAAVAVFTCMLLWPQASRVLRGLLFTTALGLVLYLHVLATRTGLGAFYLGLALYVLHLAWKRRSLAAAALLALALTAAPLLAWQFLPSFRNRVQYIRYDIDNSVRRDAYLPGANDGSRFLSIRAGWELLQAHPFGVGFGDIFPATNDWYDRHVPQMRADDRKYPHSEWLIYGVGTGWIGFAAFTFVQVIPLLYRRIRHRIGWLILNAGATFSFLFDIGLEVQYGVYLYVFLVLWWWKWLSAGKTH